MPFLAKPAPGDPHCHRSLPVVASKAAKTPPLAYPLASRLAALVSDRPDHELNTRLPAVENAPELQVPNVLVFEPYCHANVLFVMLIASSTVVKMRGSVVAPVALAAFVLSATPGVPPAFD